MQTIGERLEEARKRKGISIREAAEGTKIRGDYLHKFESNQYDINLPEIYVRGFLRAYANFLKLPSEKILADYKALGLNETKPRPVNREIYGRMDLSVSRGDAAREPEAGPSGTRPATPPAKSKDDEEDHGNPATFHPKAGSPTFDRSLMIKIGALAGGALVLLLIIVFTVRALTGGGSGTNSTTGQPTAAQPATPSITIHALDTVRIKLVDEATGNELFQDTLVRGDRKSVPMTGSILLTSTALENIEIEKDGRRYPTGQTGYSRIRIQ